MLKRKEIEQKLADAGIHYDKLVVSHKTETFKVMSGYFYHHGRTAEGWAAKVATAFPGLYVEAHDEWRAWPKDSYLVAEFRDCAVKKA